MTVPLQRSPHGAPPPPPAPAWAGPSAWPRPPRWLGIGTIARLTVRELRDRRFATWSGVATGLLAGAALGGAFGSGSIRQVAAIVLLAGGAALADTTDPSQRDDAALLLRLGCPRLVIRFAAWAGSIVALGIPAAIAAETTYWIRSTAPGAGYQPAVGNLTIPALLLTAAGAATTTGTRLTERRDASSASVVWRVARTVVSVLLILWGAFLPSTSDSGSTLDFALVVGLFFVAVGLVGLAPELAGAAVAVTCRLPWAPARVAAATLAPHRRGLTLTVAVVAALAALLVLQVSVGSGLGARERARVAAVRALGPATWAGSDRVLVVDQSFARSYGAGSSGTGPSGRSPTDVGSVVPTGTEVAVVRTVPVDALAAGGVLGDASGRTESLFGDPSSAVAIATPELLSALGLDPALAEGPRALVLDRRMIGPGGRVRLVAGDSPATIGGGPAQPGVLRRASAVNTGAAWVGLPPVLLPQDVYDDLPASVRTPDVDDAAVGRRDRVVRYAERPTAEQLRDLARAFPDADVHRGEQRVDLTRRDRSDRTSIIWVREASDVRRLALGLGAMAAVALAAALLSLRLAVRREEAVLHLLGARRRTRVAVSAVRGGALAAVATAAGASIAVAGTWWGVHWYDTRTRVDAAVVLGPIGWSFPSATFLSLAAIPVLAGAIGGALGLVGRTAPPGDR